MAGRDLIGYGPNPPAVEWPNGARIAVSFVVNYEEGSENSILDGDPLMARRLASRRRRWPEGRGTWQMSLSSSMGAGSASGASWICWTSMESTRPSSPAPWPWNATRKWGRRSFAGDMR